MTLSVLGQDLSKIAQEKFSGSLDCPRTRLKVLGGEVERKFGHRGEEAIGSFLRATSPSLHPTLTHAELATQSASGLESVVALHLRMAGG